MVVAVASCCVPRKAMVIRSRILYIYTQKIQQICKTIIGDPSLGKTEEARGHLRTPGVNRGLVGS